LHYVDIIFLVTITRSLYQLSYGIKMLLVLVLFLLINEIYFNVNWISFVINFLHFHVTFMFLLLQCCYHQFLINLISYTFHTNCLNCVQNNPVSWFLLRPSNYLYNIGANDVGIKFFVIFYYEWLSFDLTLFIIIPHALELIIWWSWIWFEILLNFLEAKSIVWKTRRDDFLICFNF
jgi:hypothetical protein